MSEVSERLAGVLAGRIHVGLDGGPMRCMYRPQSMCPNLSRARGLADALAPIVEQMLAEARAEALREAADGPASFMEPWGPFEMGGFEGCTDRDPEHCACATDEQPTCHDCGQEIEPGEKAWSRQWPCYETLPLSHRDQDWDVISWHDSCPDLRADAVEREAR